MNRRTQGKLFLWRANILSKESSGNWFIVTSYKLKAFKALDLKISDTFFCRVWVCVQLSFVVGGGGGGEDPEDVGRRLSMS